MTVREKLEDRLQDHGLWPEDATAAFDFMLEKHRDVSWIKDVKWNDPVEAYPASFFAVALITLKDAAVEWIDANKPEHYARAILAA